MASYPPKNVQLSDGWIGWLLIHLYQLKSLNIHWSADFDTNGVIQSAKTPHGTACKVFVPLDIADLMGGGEYHFGLVSGINLLVGDKEVQAHVQWHYKPHVKGKKLCWAGQPCPDQTVYKEMFPRWGTF